MANNDVQRLKNDLLVKFGMFMAPLEELLDSGTTPTVEECRLAIKRYEQGRSAWLQAVGEFVKQVQYPLMPPISAT